VDVRPAQVVIARHGNTFDAGDIVLRCGARTDLSLSNSGRRQAQALGQALAKDYADGFDEICVSTLQRTQQTAALALASMGLSNAVTVEGFLDEIDYGPDEGLPETDVVARLGQAAITAWDEQAIVPAGWQCDPPAINMAWGRFLDNVMRRNKQRVLVITSNGIARFALQHARDFEGQLKLSTGAYGVLQRQHDHWRVGAWNVRP
jgi:broad specificity phosphatase PhoE